MNYLETPRSPGIYGILNSRNGKLYVGSAVNMRGRLTTHVHRLRKDKHSNPILQSAWKKWGESNFEYLILELIEDKFWLLPREQRWLNQLEPWKREFGYNILPTAESRQGHKVSEEQKKRLLAECIKYHTGLKHSDEWKKAQSDSHKGYVFPDEQRKNLSISQKRIGNTPEEKKRRSARVAGQSNPFYGKSHTSENLIKTHNAAALGRHNRWHVSRGVVNVNCSLCTTGI